MTRTVMGNRLETIRSNGDRSSTGTVAGILTLGPLIALLALTVATNTPVGPRLPLESISAPIEASAYAGPALAAVLLGFAAEPDRMRVGLLFAGVFGGLALFAPAAAMPATIALGAAAVLVVSQALPSSYRGEPIRTAVMILFGGGVLMSMIGSLGVEPALARQVGSVAIASGLLGLPTLTGYSRRSLAVGTGGAMLVAAIGISAPVMTAAVSLLGMGIVGLPLPLLVLGALGAGTALAAAIESGDLPVALAGGIVLVAGVPSSIPGAVAVLVALGLFDMEGRR